MFGIVVMALTRDDIVVENLGFNLRIILNHQAFERRNGLGASLMLADYLSPDNAHEGGIILMMVLLSRKAIATPNFFGE